MTTAHTYTNHLGQQVSEVPGEPGRVITGRPDLVVLRHPMDVDPFGPFGPFGETEDDEDADQDGDSYSSDLDYDFRRDIECGVDL